MDRASVNASRAIEQVARAIAEWTVTAQAEDDPTIARRFGPGWRPLWVTDTQIRIRYLAQAIAVRRPEVFAEAVRQTAAAFAARSATVSDLQRNLRTIRDVTDQELPADVAGRAAEIIDSTVEGLQLAPPPPTSLIDVEHRHGRLAMKYLHALLEGRRRDAETLILDVAGHGTPIRELYLEVLQPVQAEVGRMWHAAEVTIGDEHFATATTESVMSRLRNWFPDVPARERTVVATSIGGDLHAVGVRMVADFFEMDGWQAIYLGPNMPADEIVQSVPVHDADLLALSITSSLHLRAAGELIEHLRSEETCDGLRILVGGSALAVAPDLWRELGADGTATNALDAIERANELFADSDAAKT